ncbi:MAG: hypothetical protein JWQ81_7234 [Amycolatopsis sp.]|nr:hypothetical protein [Amycolatopsis sp.]MCU1686495.1 hypothetical protein [Amycolatopsis sp.]
MAESRFTVRVNGRTTDSDRGVSTTGTTGQALQNRFTSTRPPRSSLQ